MHQCWCLVKLNTFDVWCLIWNTLWNFQCSHKHFVTISNRLFCLRRWRSECKRDPHAENSAGTDRRPHLWKVPRGRWMNHTYPMWLWSHSFFKISSHGPVSYGSKWLLWRPHKQSPTVHSKCRINKGLITRGSTIDHWMSQCHGRNGLLLIHSFKPKTPS
jgi:hypothetical protein